VRIYIETLGCPKNESDSDLFCGRLEQAGHKIIFDSAIADAIIVNTCGFINDAKKESIDTILEMARTKKSDAILVVSGCLTQRYGEELYRDIPEADIILGVNDYDKLPDLLSAFQAGKRQKYLSQTPNPDDWHFRRIPGQMYRATLKIAEGCDNCCTYCVIPQIRGSFRSRTKEDLIAEANWLAENGCKEIILIAQDVTAYGLDLYGKFALPELLSSLCAIDGIRWIRLMYCYEDRITNELIDIMAQEPKICHYIDIPLQHYSLPVLQAMKRRSTPESILNTIKRLREAMPDIHIRTTLITGFPGETAADYDMLLDFIMLTRFERLGVFAYSKEEGTPAGEMKGQIAERVKTDRRDGIMMRQMEISRQLNQNKIGQTLEVIIDELDSQTTEKNDENPVYTYIGRTKYDAPEIDHTVLIQTHKSHEPGDMIQVLITDGFDYDIVGLEV
jgi:ribosomal protein S12 methylthiotransferase